MTLAEVLVALSDEEVVGLTIWAEARQEPLTGRVAVGCIIRNRVRAQQRRFGLTYREVCLKPWQFSCWLPQGGESNHRALLEQAKMLATTNATPAMPLRNALWIAQGVMNDTVEDIVKGATHYYSPDAMKPKGRVPDWAHPPAVLTAVIHRHRFYKGA
jgi:N-acetylmuramoyl-L-alanine amidase